MTGQSMRLLNVLVVDDDPSIVRLLRHLLEQRFGAEIVLVAMTDSTAASRWIDENCCDILLTDIEMPDIDGLELLRIAKTRNAWTQGVILTAHSTWDRLDEAIQNGACDYLVKPLVAADVLNVVSQRIDQATRWQRAASLTLLRN